MLQGIQTQFDVYHDTVEEAAPEVHSHPPSCVASRQALPPFVCTPRGWVPTTCTSICSAPLPLHNTVSALCPQVHEAVDAAFERAFESVEPFLNKTGELGGVTPYSEVGLYVLDKELHGICTLHPPSHGARLA